MGRPATSDDKQTIQATLDLLSQQVTNPVVAKQHVPQVKPAIDALVKYADTELHTLSAVAGGVLGNEVVRAIARDGAPLRNVYVHSMLDGLGKAMCTAW